jgi:hypothetical protein
MGLGKGGFKLSDLIISICLFYQNEGEVVLGCVAVLSMQEQAVYPAYNSSRPLDKSKHTLFVYLHVSLDTMGKSRDLQLEQGKTLSHFAFNRLHSEQLFAPLPPFAPFFAAAEVAGTIIGLGGSSSSCSSRLSRLSRTWIGLSPRPSPARAKPASTSSSLLGRLGVWRGRLAFALMFRLGFD